MAGALPRAGRVSLPLGSDAPPFPMDLCLPGDCQLFDEGSGVLLAVHADPVDPATLPLRSADAVRLAGTVPDLGGQHAGDGSRVDFFQGRFLMAIKGMRRRELAVWGKLDVPQIRSGLKVTSVHFFPNLARDIAHRLRRL